jgi:hypothetical protein
MAGLKLARWIEGDDAIKAINKLHGMPIDVERGFIAHYEGTYDKATVWVSEASTEDLAKRQIAVMMRKMQDNTKSPFGHYRTLNIKGLEVSAFDGMGQVHYVFRDKQWVYWASADERRIDEILRHIRKNRY